jgi:hypothetical protein
VIESRSSAGFGQNSSAAFGVARNFVRKNLDGDGAAQARVLRAIDFSHAARAKWR